MSDANTPSGALLTHLATIAEGPLENATCSPAQLYTDEEIATYEKERIFRKDWICPGLAAEIPNTGDYLTFTIAEEPVYCIRNKDGEVKTYANVCRHRMMKLVEGHGNKSKIVCPYHAWTYNLDGQLTGAGHMEYSSGFKKSEICLPEIRTEIWNGWIYVTLNPDAVPVEDALADLNPVVEKYGMENYVPVVQQDHVWQTNWKLLVENFMEGYHLPVAHKATVGAWFPVEATVFPDNVYDNFTYQTFKKVGDAVYGQAHPDNTTLEGDDRITSILPSVFPTHMYVLAPDHLWYLSLRPKEIGQVDVRFGVAIAPEVDRALSDPQKRETWIAELITFFDHVNTEDRQVVEGIFAGSRSAFATSGQLSWLEREIHDFQKYLSRRLIDKEQ